MSIGIKDIKSNGRIAQLVCGRKSHKCCECGYPTEPFEEYYEICPTDTGPANGNFPDSIHRACINNYRGKR